jgi:hypothetical protein
MDSLEDIFDSFGKLRGCTLATITGGEDSTHFPVLQQIVPSTLYLFCRQLDASALQLAGQAIDWRIACPKKWKKADSWEDRLRGKDLWVHVEGEYLQQS